jgi:glycosyltransferase involved in cell wall biosynthesis
MKTKVLYISYDGMTDPLGQSQVLPYLIGLTRYGYEFTILSFEKKDRWAANHSVIEKITNDNGIKWEPLSFTRKPPLVAKFYDMVRMRRKAFSLYRKNRYDMVHCRSYPGADVGLSLKKKFGVKFFFDMRGFWADEKKDGGAWNVKNPLFRSIYNYYKKKEKQYLQNADYIISLTEAGKREIQKWPSYEQRVPIGVVPCCADMQHFTLTSDSMKARSRELLGLSNDAFVLSYLGSVGAWYMLDEMLKLFAMMKAKFPGAKFLFITHSDPAIILDRLTSFGINASDTRIVQANRKQVPEFVKASDISVSFIKPVYSKLSSSPTKLGELLAMGIPVITNSGVGDVKEIVDSAGGGYVLDGFSDTELRAAIDAIPELIKREPAVIRERAQPFFDLETGIMRYKNFYEYALKN